MEVPLEPPSIFDEEGEEEERERKKKISPL